MASNVSVDKILVPTDFSEISLVALDYAAWIAHQQEAEILLLHVFESYMQNTMLEMQVDFSEIIEKGIEKKFEEVKAKNPNLSGITLHSRVAVGKIHSEIDRIAAEEGIKLIVMGTHGVSGVTNIGKYIMGSNSYRTIQNSPCPIITLREAPRHRGVKSILVPLDSTPESTEKIDIAIRWAKFFKAKFHLLAVTAFFEEFVVDVKEITHRVREIEEKLEAAGIDYEAHIHRHNAPSESVIEYADKVNADIIFVVTGQKSTLKEMLFGSSARSVISESPIPVMSINVKHFHVAALDQ